MLNRCFMIDTIRALLEIYALGQLQMLLLNRYALGQLHGLLMDTWVSIYTLWCLGVLYGV